MTLAVKDDAEGEVRQVKEFDRLEAIFLTGITRKKLR